MSGAVDDQLCHYLPGRRRVKNASDAVPGGDIGTGDFGQGPINGSPSLVTGR
jgi:hypothetical protein